jgi:hypothetical protein
MTFAASLRPDYDSAHSINRARPGFAAIGGAGIMANWLS